MVGDTGISVAYIWAGSRQKMLKVEDVMVLDLVASNTRLRILGFCLFLSIGLSCSNSDTQLDLIGTWQGKGSEMLAVVFKFERDGSFHFRYVDPDGAVHIFTGKYEVGFSKLPFPLSLRKIPQLPHPLHTIIQFRRPDKLRMGRFARHWKLRPISFDPESEILLERQ